MNTDLDYFFPADFTPTEEATAIANDNIRIWAQSGIAQIERYLAKQNDFVRWCHKNGVN